jgi:hypothetical protein
MLFCCGAVNAAGSSKNGHKWAKWAKLRYFSGA